MTNPEPGLGVLVVDDEKLSRETTVKQLRAAGFKAQAHDSAFSALQALEEELWDVVLTDLRMPGMDGLEFLEEINNRSPETSVFLMTAFGSIDTAVEAMRKGALDYLTKPFDFEELRIRLERVREGRETRNEVARLRRIIGSTENFSGLVGSSECMRRVFERIEQFSDNPSNVLIVGETGTGKELVARALHERSPYATKPFIAIGCASIPRELAESELFGHEAGAFTGARQRRRGKIELARGGTLFLDDVDDLPMEIQAKLLRVIQEREFERVGGEQSIRAEMRLISATKADLTTLIKEGGFREDLMYRLKVLVIELPPLKDRRDDILILARHFLGLLARERDQPEKSLSSGASEQLVAYDWPGNVRQLRHAVESALAISKGQDISAEDLPPEIRPASEAQPYAISLEDVGKLDFRALTERFERDLIQHALKKTGGHQGKAAELLGIPRTTLQSKLK